MLMETESLDSAMAVALCIPEAPKTPAASSLSLSLSIYL